MTAFVGPLLHIALALTGVGIGLLGIAAVAYVAEKIWKRFDEREGKTRPAKKVIHKIGTVFWDDSADRMVIKAFSAAKQALLDEKTKGREATFVGAPGPIVQEQSKGYEIFPDYGQTIPEITLPKGLPGGLPRPPRELDLDDTTETSGEIKLNTIDIAAVDPDKTPVRKYRGPQ